MRNQAILWLQVQKNVPTVYDEVIIRWKEGQGWEAACTYTQIKMNKVTVRKWGVSKAVKST